MQRVPRWLRPRIGGPLIALLLLSAGAHAALLVMVEHAYPPSLVRVPVDYRGQTIACAFGPARPTPVPKAEVTANSPASSRTNNGGERRLPELQRHRVAQSIHTVFDRHQAELDQCTVRFGRFANWTRMGTPYEVHIEVEYGRLKSSSVVVYAREPKLDVCLRQRIRQWDDWPMDARIVIDVLRESRWAK